MNNNGFPNSIHPMKKNIQFLILVLGLGLFKQVLAQENAVKQVKVENFDLQSSSLIPQSGMELSQSTYISKDYWFPVKVPTTVLRGLVSNHIYPDPYLGLNNMLIPDASDEFNKTYNLEQYSFLPNEPNPWKKPYWYRTHFKVPASDQWKFFQLIFKGINYRAAVYLNGKLIADSTQMAGMFADYNLEVSSTILPGKENYLAVKIFPLDYPGLPSQEQLKAFGPFFDNGGPTGDIGKNVSMLCSVGWDWMPPVRDRNMGIWQPVYLRTTGAVSLGKPLIKTDLAKLPDTNEAKISLDLNLTNHSNKIQSGQLKVWISPGNFSGNQNIQFSKSVNIPAGSSIRTHLDDQSIAQLLIKNPKLWWPNLLGKPNLYRIRLEFQSGNQIMDDTTFLFGIRTVGTRSTMVNGFSRREFLVNGQKVHLVGGAWVPDFLLNRDSARYTKELQLCRNANINLVRIWGGGITPPDIFFDLADQKGLLIWSDFWVTGDTQGEFKGSPDYPLESTVFIKNAISTILRIRNHPSLLLWTGGNEGHARKELYDAMRTNIIALDGTRPFIPSSSGFAHLPQGWDASYPDNTVSGVYSSGPYSWQDPKIYYNLVDGERDWLFKDETGIPSQPPYTTLPKIITNLVWDKKLAYPLNDSWGYHDAASGNGHYELYYQEMVKRFGAPTSMEDFSDKMQLMNAIGYQGIFESVNHRISETGGVMLWKLNAALPSVIWQVYDWYLEPNAGYYFMQNALEPVHIQMNLKNNAITLVNRTHRTSGMIHISAQVFDINSKLLFEKKDQSELKDLGSKELFSLKEVLEGHPGINFIILNAKDDLGKQISHNTYWIAQDTNYKALSKLPEANLETKIISKKAVNGKLELNLSIQNKSDQIAFFIRPQIQMEGEEVLPSYWSKNYFTLGPKESIEVQVNSELKDNASPKLIIKGMNVNEIIRNL